MPDFGSACENERMQRTPEELKEHYLIERELGDRLRRAERCDRAALYGALYDELFRRVPRHPQLARKQNAEVRAEAVAVRLLLVGRFLRPDTVFLEIGAGDASLSREVARRVRKCYALDVSREILDLTGAHNLEPILSDGCSVPVPRSTVTLAYSNQLMEHIHPDDAVEQLRNIFAALAPGGTYLCVTPNRLNGPHDISRLFDDAATGLHLKEYTVTELSKLFRAVGFSRIVPYVGLSHRYFRMPLGALIVLEALVALLPGQFRRRIWSLRGLRNLLFISIAAIK